MDCSIVPTGIPDLFTISTIDFFYPLVEDPYLQGRIGCANVLSDLYAMGVSECDTMLMTLACSREMPENIRDIVTKEMIRGFNDLATEAGTKVTGGQSIMNPWPIIGGVAIAVRHKSQFIRPIHAKPGDKLVLTKPIGTQIAVNFHQWMLLKNERWNNIISKHITEDEVNEAFEKAGRSMARLNRNGARLMMKYKAHAGTDVTGFGLFGHSNNLAKAQSEKVLMKIHTLPIIAKMKLIDELIPGSFNLRKGRSAETSGGLLICLAAEDAENFVREIEEIDHAKAWIIGDVFPCDDGEPRAEILEDAQIVEV